MSKNFIVFAIALIVIITGCSKEVAYVGSKSIPEFSIPKEAKYVEQQEGEYEKYLYNAQGGANEIRDDYYKAIENWGWKEKI
ncbi:hypothetical protein [Paenibacillus marinisediminis]